MTKQCNPYMGYYPEGSYFNNWRKLECPQKLQAFTSLQTPVISGFENTQNFWKTAILNKPDLPCLKRAIYLVAQCTNHDKKFSDNYIKSLLQPPTSHLQVETKKRKPLSETSSIIESQPLKGSLSEIINKQEQREGKLSGTTLLQTPLQTPVKPVTNIPVPEIPAIYTITSPETPPLPIPPLSTAPLSTAPLSTAPLSTAPLSTPPLQTPPLLTTPLPPSVTEDKTKFLNTTKDLLSTLLESKQLPLATNFSHPDFNVLVLAMMNIPPGETNPQASSIRDRTRIKLLQNYFKKPIYSWAYTPLNSHPYPTHNDAAFSVRAVKNLPWDTKPKFDLIMADYFRFPNVYMKDAYSEFCYKFGFLNELAKRDILVKGGSVLIPNPKTSKREDFSYCNYGNLKPRWKIEFIDAKQNPLAFLTSLVSREDLLGYKNEDEIALLNKDYPFVKLTRIN